MTAPEFVDQRRAAQLCGSSYDRIRRRREAGAYPNARIRPGDDRNTWEIPLGDLIAAGDFIPPAGLSDQAGVEAVLVGEELIELRRELEDLRSRYERQSERLEAATDELRFLRSVVAKAAA